MPSAVTTTANHKTVEAGELTHAPNALEQAASFVGAARSAKEPDLRAFYAAKARLAIGSAERELEALRVNLKSLEDQLPKGSAA